MRNLKETKAAGIKKLEAHHTDAQSYDAIHLFAKVMKEQNVSGTKSSLTADRLAIKEGLKTVKFSGILGDNLCFSGNDAELPGYDPNKDQKWTLMASHAGSLLNLRVIRICILNAPKWAHFFVFH